MNLDEMKLVMETLAPIVGATGDLISRILGGSVQLAQAKAEIKGILAVAASRLDAYDEIFTKRDALEDARVKKP